MSLPNLHRLTALYTSFVTIAGESTRRSMIILLSVVRVCALVKVHPILQAVAMVPAAGPVTFFHTELLQVLSFTLATL